MPLIPWDSPTVRADPNVNHVVGDFIRDVGPWTWWLTLTFAGPVTPGRAMDLLRAWTKALARELRAHVDLAWVLDNNGGHWHIHALLGHPDALPVTASMLDHLWRSIVPGLTGHSKIGPYNNNKGAAFYIGKKTDRFDWSISVACPRRPQCRRKKGCVRSPQFAW